MAKYKGTFTDDDIKRIEDEWMADTSKYVEVHSKVYKVWKIPFTRGGVMFNVPGYPFVACIRVK